MPPQKNPNLEAVLFIHVPLALAQAVKARARQNDRTLSAEVRVILKEALTPAGA